MPSRMSLRLFPLGILTLALVAACQGPPPTQYLLEVTREVTRIVIVTATPEGAGGAIVTGPTATPQPTTTPAPGVTPSPTTDPFPTPVSEQIIVAEQLFQNGRMFYLQPIDRIWVMIEGDDENSGIWRQYPDTWEEGMPESDPSIEPPEDLYQPVRGFGKLWRENPDVREELGWATTTEFGHVTQYQYYAGGQVTAEGEYVTGPGEHTLRSHFDDRDTFIFDEADGTWAVAASTEN